MASIQCRPEVNALTVPQSYKLRYVPRDSMGTDGLAAAMVSENPNYSVEDNRCAYACQQYLRSGCSIRLKTNNDGIFLSSSH
jgi:hypothetical protein